MRIRIIHSPTSASVDGVALDRFVLGCQYEVSNLLGAVFLAEGWAEPVDSEQPAVLTPYNVMDEERPVGKPSNLVREIFPREAEAPRALAADRRRRRRRPI